MLSQYTCIEQCQKVVPCAYDLEPVLSVLTVLRYGCANTPSMQQMYIKADSSVRGEEEGSTSRADQRHGTRDRQAL
jgi:hypothetical protein